jgi:Lrp/AsnC family leucine-responsive transcriptional regulator
MRGAIVGEVRLLGMWLSQAVIARWGNGLAPKTGAFDRRTRGRVPVVPTIPRPDLDRTDALLIECLQRDARVSIADLGRTVSLSASATADRLRRLVDAGVITGYTALLSPESLGYQITAFVRVAYPSGNYKPFHDLLSATPEIIEAHHVTGSDCFIVKTLARSMLDLERITGRLATLGTITTHVVYSSPLPRRNLTPASEQDNL